MIRQDRQSDRYLESKLSEWRDVLDDLKAVQKFGASNVRIARIESAAWNSGTQRDIVFDMSPSATCIEVTLTPNSRVRNPVIAFLVDVKVFTPTGTSYRTPLIIPQAPDPSTGLQKWHIYTKALTGSTITGAAMSFGFWAISEGTFTATKLF